MKTEGWQKRFRQVIDRYAETEFKWGESDCVVFGYECAQAVTGEPVAIRVHMKFGDWNSCRKAFRAHKGRLGEAVNSFLGQSVSVNHLSMGDLALAIYNGREAIVVCDGLDFLGPAPEKGLQKVPREFIQYGWIL